MASPSAHGQAMISTATAAVNATVADAPISNQAASVSSDSPMTIGDEDRRDPVGQALHLGLAALRVGDQPGDLRELGVGADAGGADLEPSSDVDGRADDAVAGADLDGHGLAGQHRRVDRRRAGHHDAVGGDLLAGPHDEDVADGEFVYRNARVSADPSRRTATSLAPMSSSARSAAPDCAWRATRNSGRPG